VAPFLWHRQLTNSTLQLPAADNGWFVPAKTEAKERHHKEEMQSEDRKQPSEDRNNKQHNSPHSPVNFP
jgi:hypothetical protein